MNARIKFLTYNQNGSYIEDANGAIPCLEWSTSLGDIKRIFPYECRFQLQQRNFRIDIITLIQTKSGNWTTDVSSPQYFLEASDNSFVNKTTGALDLSPYMNDLSKPIYSNIINDHDGKPVTPSVIGYEKKLKPNLISEAQFFIDAIGKNKNNLPVKLYDFFLGPIARKEGLTIVS